MRFSIGHHDPVVHRRRHRLGRAFAVVVIVWSLIRTWIVWAMVGRYGLDPYLYFALDLSSATVAAFATPRMVFHFVDDRLRRALSWGIFNLVAFVVPDAYLFVGTHRLPWPLVMMVCTMVSATFAATAVGVRRRVRMVRAEQAAALAVVGT